LLGFFACRIPLCLPNCTYISNYFGSSNLVANQKLGWRTVSLGCCHQLEVMGADT
jgi:hypothetical protein